MGNSPESPPERTALDPPVAEYFCPTCDQIYASAKGRCPTDGTALVRLSEPKDPLLGRELDGRFTLKKRIGAGGMGAVYLAWQHSVGREVAVKVIHPKHNTDREAAKRFLRESKLASRLQHPNTVTVLDFNQTEDGFLYLVMELLNGRQLSEVLQQEGRFSTQRLAKVAIQLCDALEAAHNLSIVHRDLKPGNIIILDGPPGRDFVKVLDFGLARSLGNDDSSKLTRTGEVVGTPHYLPPEAALGNPMDTRGDIYSLGVIFYELVAGRLPFEAEGRRAMMIKHVYEDPIPLPLDVPEAVSNLIMKMLEKDPDQRPRSVVELRMALTDLVSPSGPTALPPSRPGVREPSQRVASSPQPAPGPTPQGPTPRPGVPPEDRAAFASETSVVPTLPAAPSARRWWLLALGPIVGALLGVGYWMVRTPAPAPLPTSTPIKVEAPSVPSPIVTPLPVPMVKLTFRSKPASTVKVGGKELGRTPQTIDVPRSEQPLDVTFTEPGRKPSAHRVVPTRDDTVDATLPAEKKKGTSGGKAEPKEEFILGN